MATTSALYATAAATAGAATWTNTANAVGSTSANFATWTSAVNAATSNITLSGYNFQTLIGSPPASVGTIDATIKGYVSNTTNISTVTAQLMSGATNIGSAVTLTKSTTTTNSQTITFATAPTWAQLADIRVMITVAHGANTTSATYNLDYISLTSTYTAASVTLPFTETWTGTTGAAWPPQWTIQSGTGTIQSNGGQLVASGGAYFSGRADLTSMAVAGDTDVVVTFTPSSVITEMYIVIGIDGDGTGAGQVQPDSGYTFWASPLDNQISLDRCDGSSDTQLVNGAFTFAASTAYSVRFQRVGTTLRARIWAASGSEPTTWALTAILADTPKTGRMFLGTQNGSDGVSKTVTFDNLTVSVPGQFFLWSGTAETALTLDGVWNGTTIITGVTATKT